MIRIHFLVLQEGDIAGFGITGHSGYAEIGSDIVCAAVSSAAFMAVNTLTDVLGIRPKQIRAEDADLYLRLEEKDLKACQGILEGLKNHLYSLEEQYDEFIHVTDVEVSQC